MVPIMIVHDVIKRYLVQKYFLSILSLNWTLELHLLFCSVKRSLYCEGNKHTHTHTHTYTSTNKRQQDSTQINTSQHVSTRTWHKSQIITSHKLLEKDNSVPIHQRSLQILAIEMLKVSNGLSPVLMNDIFKLRGEQTCNLKKLSHYTMAPKVHHFYDQKYWTWYQMSSNI